MDVRLDRDAFLKGLQLVQNIVEPRQTLPILANVLLETDGDTVRVSATDLEVGARVAVPAQVSAGGAVTVSARKLAEIVRELPAAGLTLRVGENASVAIRCGGVSYRLVGLPPDDFPAITPGPAGAWVKLDASLLREMLVETSFAISHDESRYALNGVLVAFSGKEARLVATDGHRLAVSTRAVDLGVGPVTGIVPRKAIAEVLRVVGSGEEVEVAITENQFVLQMPNFVMTARLIEGQFPNYEAVLPKDHPGKLVLVRSAFQAALRRVSVMADDRNKAVKLVLEPGHMKLSASSQELGDAEEVLDVEYPGEEVAIGFNSRYLLDALAPIEKDEVLFEFKDSLSPGVIKSVGNDGYRCVIMPMRI